MATRTATCVNYHSFPSRLRSSPTEELPAFSSQIATKLIRAIEEGDFVLLQNILRSGADPNSRLDKYGTTAIHVAAGFKGANVDWMLERLLLNGGNPNIRNTENLTPVHVACIENRKECLRLLMEYGGDPSIRCEEGFTAMGYARKYRSIDCIKFLTDISLLGSDENGYKLDNSPVFENSVCSEYFSCSPNAEYVDRIVPTNPSQTSHSHRRSHSLVSRRDRSTESRVPDKSSFKRSSSGNRSVTRSSSSGRGSLRTSPRAALSSDDSDEEWNSRFPQLLNGSCTSISKTRSEETLLEKQSMVLETPARCKNSSERDWKPQVEKAKKNQDFDEEFASYTSVTDSEIRKQLRKFGEEPGPIESSSSRAVYIRKLIALKRIHSSGERIPKKQLSFCNELEKVISGSYDRDEIHELEQEFQRCFHKSGRTSNLGYFTYLLLDPRISQNLPHQVREGSDANVVACARVFMQAIFYVGKGKNSRPRHHLSEAKLYCLGEKKGKVSEKVKRIAAIWYNDYGVVSLQCFNGLTEDEAYTREHIMMEALGMERITNVRRSTAYGEVASWPSNRRRMLGSYFLIKAFRILLQDGERQIFPQNVE